MKKISTNKFRSCTQVFLVMALGVFTGDGTAFADNISKTFEFGPGLTLTRSNVRTFPIPCGTEGEVAAVVKFQRLGPDGSGNNVPIVIEFREPDTATDVEGPVVETKSVNATKTEQTVILRSQSSNRGCTLPWRVRVKYANDGAAPVQVFGSIRLDFDGRSRNISIGRLYDDEGIRKGKSKTVNFGDSGGLEQGKVEITATWYHAVYTPLLPGPNPVKLKFELIDPSGTVVKTVEAYSSNESRSGLPKFKLTHQVTNCVSGQWKLKITNIDPDNDAGGIDPTVKFTPGCP